MSEAERDMWNPPRYCSSCGERHEGSGYLCTDCDGAA